MTRRSTSGGLIMLGNHMIKFWSSSQPVIALSSGEAEFYALVKSATQAKVPSSLMRDFDLEVDTTIHADPQPLWAWSTDKGWDAPAI